MNFSLFCVALFLSFLPICLPNPLQLDSSGQELPGGERSAEYRDIRAEIVESSKQAQNYFSYAESVSISLYGGVV